jgi:hypothetical protein
VSDMGKLPLCPGLRARPSSAKNFTPLASAPPPQRPPYVPRQLRLHSAGSGMGGEAGGRGGCVCGKRRKSAYLPELRVFPSPLNAVLCRRASNLF